METLGKGKIRIDRLLSWSSYCLLESPVILLEPVQVAACSVSQDSPTVSEILNEIRFLYISLGDSTKEFEEKAGRPIIILAQGMAVVFPVHLK